jgi:hypothetical protein
MSERPYKGVVLGRQFAAALTSEDASIFKTHGPGFRAFYGRSDRGDAEKIFACVDSAKKKEDVPDRGM